MDGESGLKRVCRADESPINSWFDWICSIDEVGLRWVSEASTDDEFKNGDLINEGDEPRGDLIGKGAERGWDWVEVGDWDELTWHVFKFGEDPRMDVVATDAMEDGWLNDGCPSDSKCIEEGRWREEHSPVSM